MKPVARNVSRVLKAAGFARAGRYTVWGYDGDGFIAMQQFDYAGVTRQNRNAREYAVVAWTGRAGDMHAEPMAAALRAAGFADVRIVGRDRDQVEVH